MTKPSSLAALGVTTLVTGADEFIAERTIGAVRRAVQTADADADMSDLSASELGPGAFAEITSPSLFASMRCVVVHTLEDLPDDAVEPLLAYVAAPAPDVALVLHHTSGVKGKAFLDKLRKAGVVEVKAAPLKKWELAEWVVAEVRGHGAKIDDRAARALVDAIGEDIRGLAGAAEQLAADCAGDPITDSVVRRYFGGRAEVKGFAVADAAINGKTGDAFEQLRWAFANGVDPVLITSAVAGGLRGVARYLAATRGIAEADLAREVGVPAWKLKSLSAQSRGWALAVLPRQSRTPLRPTPM